MAYTVITSDDSIPIEVNFKVSAGPGAGKTHWLINHIKRVISNSKRLGTGRKIACITYTNIGVETIKSRLSYSHEKVYVGTIHNFLFENVVKYYMSFIADEEGFRLDKMKVIDDEMLSGYRMVKGIGEAVSQKYLDQAHWNKAITNCRWHLDNTGLVFKPNRPYSATSKFWASIKQEAFIIYKKKLWTRGIMTYDDILYFAYKIIIKYPLALEVLRATYPYLFIDEFQDSTPLQVDILKRIAQSSTIIGVIGDKAQSIYGFAGADPHLFDGFVIAGRLEEYNIETNRRSTDEIIDLLNAIRKDITQEGILHQHGAKTIVYVGDRIKAFEVAKQTLGHNEELNFLSFRNDAANSMREQYDNQLQEENLLNSFVDSDDNRVNTIIVCIKAIEYSRQGLFKDAFRQTSKLDLTAEQSVSVIKKFLKDYDDFKERSLSAYIEYINSNFARTIKVARLNAGKAKNFYDSHSYMQVAMEVGTFEKHVLYETIHKAKGDEFDNVFVGIDRKEKGKGKGKELDFLLNPDILSSEEQRVYYVAISRAKKRLFIQYPKLSDKEMAALKRLPMDVIKID